MKPKNQISEFVRFLYSLFKVFPHISLIRRGVIVSIGLLSISLYSLGQAVGDYRTRATGNWNANTTWQIYNGAWVNCLAGDYPGVAAGAGTVNIAGNFTVSVTANVPNNISALTFGGANESNIVQFSGAFVLNITGAVTINPPTTGPNVNGIFVNAGIITCSSLTSSNSGSNDRDCSITISTGTLTVNGAVVMGINQNRNDITFSDAGILNVTGNLTTGQLTCAANSIINIGGALTPNAFTVSTSTVNYYGNAQNIANFPYFNLSTSNSGIKTLPNNNIVVAGNLDVSNSTLAFTSTAIRTLTVTGDVSGNGTIDMSPGNRAHSLLLGGANNDIGTLTTAAAASVVNYNRAGGQAIFTSPNYRNLTVSGGGDKSLLGNVTVGGTLALTSGKIILGTYDLTLAGAAAVAGAGAANFIVADGSGQLKKVFAAGATGAYILPVGDITGTIDYSPVSLTYTANSIQRTIGVRVTDAIHPNDGGSSDNISRYWSFTDDQSGTYTYNASFTYSVNAPTDLTGVYANLRVNRWDGSLSNWTQYTTTGVAPTITVTGVTETSSPLDGNDFTGRTNGVVTYLWNQTGAVASWVTPSDWTPARLSPQPGDILIFDNNGTTTATNVPTQTIGKLILSNNSDVNLQSAAAAQTLTISGGTGTDLDIPVGTTLQLSSTGGNQMGIAFNPATQDAAIAGSLIINANTGLSNSYTATNSNTAVTGTIQNNGGVITSTAANLNFNAGAIYNHSRDGGIIPISTWNSASDCNITGLTATAPTQLGQNFGNINYSSGYALTLIAALPIAGNLDISAGSIAAAGQTINLTGNLTGTANLSFTTGVLNIGGNYSNSGLFTCGTGTVNFNGAAQQLKSTIYYNLTLAGSGDKTMLGDITVGRTATFTGNSLVLNGFTLNLNFATALAAGTITGNSTSNISITGAGTPAMTLPNIAGGLQNLTINKTGANNTVTLGGNLDIAGAANFTAGALVLNGRTLNINGTTTVGTGTITGSATSSIGIGSSDNAGIILPNITVGLLDFLINKTGTTNTVALGGPLTTTGSLTLTDGALFLNNFALVINGQLTQTSGTLTGGGTSDITIGTPAGAAISLPAVANGLRNFTQNRTAGVTLTGANTITGILTLTSGVLKLGDYDLTLSNTNPIAGAPFSAARMIETSGTGRLIRSANATNDSFNLTYPVGSGGYYNPLIVTGLPNLFAAPRIFSVGAVPANLGVLTNSINKYWDLSTTNITTNPTTMLSFAYNAGEVVGDPLVLRPYTNTSGTYNYATGPSAPGANPATSTGSPTISGFWTVGANGTFYSYQTGDWNQTTTWTTDPGGTTGPGTTIPGLNDKVVILSGRTVSLPADVTDQNLDVTINAGGFLNQTTFRFTNNLAALRGDGVLMLSSANFPTAVINTFVTTDGGTTEYNNNGFMSAAQAVYYHLVIRSAGTVIQVANITLNGNLSVKQGTFQINDATTRKLSLTINGDVTVDNGCSITVGTGVTNTVVSPTGINGTTGGYLNYYELQSHRVQIFGDFTNNGTVRFTNLTAPLYNSFPPIITGPTTGFATVYFQGLSDKALSCNGPTDFYNLVLDKGSDQTFKLTVYSAAYNYFRLFGANTSAGDNTAPATTANPNLKKALWIRTGTLVLQGLTVIPSLSEGATAGPPSSDFFIPSKAALLMDGGGVIVLSTADDYTEVNAAYGIAGGSNAAYGINTTGGNSGLSVLGKLQLNTGYLSTRESAGLLYWSYAPGQIILNGGTLDIKQFHNPEGAATGLISYVQNSGNVIVRGRFTNTINYTTPVDLSNPVINTARVPNSIDIAAGIGSFSISSNAANAYSVSGGALSIYDVCNTTATPLAFLVNSPPSNINITGGTVSLIPTTGTLLADANYLVNSTAPFNNLIINRVSGAASVQLNSNPLIVLNDLTLNAGALISNNLDITIGGNYLMAAGTTYTTGTNSTIFNGAANQAFTVNLAAPLSLNKLTIDKPAGIALNFAGTQPIINVGSDFRLVLGTMNDNGNTVNIAGNVYNSGIHSGTGKVVLNGTLTQSIDGNGIFGNLELNNTNAAVAPVSLLANTTLNGLLTFSQDKLFDIRTFNLRLNSSAAIVNGGALRYVKSAGNVGDGGLTKVYSTPAAFNFPVGVVNYTPGSIGFTGLPAAYGSITVIPVNFEHSNVTISGRSLNYFWRVKSTGFTLGAATVTHGYTYDQSNVITGAGITEAEYVAARFELATNTWTKGTTADVDETNNIIGEPGPGSFLENVPFIDGDYTAGDDNPVSPFGTPTVYYSRINGLGAGNGLWSDVNTWSTDGVLQHAGAPAASVPGISDIVIIGGRDSVYLATTNTIPNTDARSCASLKIEKGSALDIGYNFNSSFGMVLNHTNGNGNFRLTTSWNDQSTFTFPSGDFSDFNVNLGTTELYSTNPAAGTTYWLPNGVLSYGNLILSPLGGSNIIFANNNLTIYGNLITRGQNADSWFLPTWNTNYPTPPIPVIAKTITINGDMDIQGGALIWYGNGALAQNFIVNGNVKVATLSALYVWSGATNQSMAIAGSLINNTDGLTHGLTTTSKVDFTGVPLTFFGSNSASISNTGGNPLTVFGTVTVNKGTSQAVTLTLDIAGTLTTPADNWLTLQNGTFRYMRTNPGSDFTISTTTPFTIPATAGLLVNLPSNAGNRNILIGNAANTTGDLLLSGKLTIVNGNVYIGPTASPASANDIEYSSSGASSIEIQGGNLVVNGQIRRSPFNAGAILRYSQSGGNVIVNGQNSNATNAKFEVLNGGSDFTKTNGTLTIVRGNGATITPSSPFGDLYIRPETSSVTGGTIVFSQGALTTQNYFLDANIPLNNLTITGAAGQPATVRLLTSPLVLNGNMTINANSILNSNNINITFNGNLINTPGVGGYVFGTNLTTFSATNGSPFAGAQTITGSTNFYDLVVNPGTSLTLSNPSTVNRNLTLSSGTFMLGGNTVSLKGDLQNDASYTDNNAVGSGILINGVIQQQITGTGAYARLTLNNAAGARIENDITIQEDLTMTLGILDIKKNLVSLGVNCNIQGAPFGPTKMITSDGVFSNVGLRKFFNPGATTFLYPIGTAGKYTPALLTVTASNTVGYVRINNINSRHPAILDPSNALDYYWEVQSSGITGFSGSLVLNYLQGDVVGDEANYLAARLLVPGTSWSQTLGVAPAANTITFNYITSNNLSGEYTAGTSGAFPGNVPIYTSNADGNWTNQAIWTQTGGDPYPVPPGGPNGFIVIINHEVTLDANFCTAYRTTINNKLKVTSLFFGHNLGTVDGSGTLYLESGSFPAGVYTAFLNCASNATIEYGGTGTYTIIADLYDNIPNIVFSGTGTRVLPDKNLTICNQLIINGPTLDNSIYNRKLFIQGSMSRLAGAFKSGNGAGATVSFEGSGPQTIGGILGDFTGSNSFNNFEINNGAGLRVNDAGAIEVSGNLLLTNGLINTGGNRKLTVTNSNINCVLPAGGTINSFVDGPLIKRISQYDNFLFPIGIYIAGPGNILGNNLKISSTQTGPLLWSAQYKNPNSTSANVTAPLLGVSAIEYYTVQAPAGSLNILNINWVPTGDVTPLITGGLSNIRLAKYDTGTSKWIEVPTTASGTNFNGTATSIGFVTSTGSDDYTLGSITDLKPRAKLSPVGPVCGAAGIPVTFTAPFSIPFNYTLSYTIDGTAQVPVTVTSVPYTLPTPVPGVYKLTDFTYNNGAQIGVVDASSISVYAVPTTASAGLDQTLCGITTVILTGNTPVVGTGLWSILSGAGGTLIAPSNPTSQFIGLNGVSYTLRWTISSGTCTSSEDVNINFTILPDAPAAAPSQGFCGPHTISNLVATPPVGCTIDWYNAASGGVLLPGATSLVSGTTYYAESNGGGGCKSLTRTAVVATINSIPVPGLIGPNLVCIGSAGNVYSTEPGKSNYIWSVVGGFITSGGLGTDNTATVTWNTLGPQTISVNYQDVGGCTAAAPTIYNVTVNTDNTVNRTSPVGTDAQTVCINTAITNITYATTGATGATVTGLPAGVSGSWLANVVTISGTPTAAGPFTYTVTPTGGCGVVTATGSITVTPNNTVNITSAAGTDAQTVCINTAITNITYATTGATGATVTGLPAGVTGSWLADVVTISGTPTAAGPFTYTVTLMGGCGVVTATGTITVTPNNTVNITSAAGTDAQTVCINTAISNITYATTGATGATVTGLPAGVSGSWLADVVTISGTPTAAGPFTYTVTLTGGCGVVTATGSITVTPDNTVNITSAAGTDAQTVCINTAITNITYATTGATGATVTGLPAGASGSWLADVVTISGTPTAAGPFTYTVTPTGGCGVVTATGTITVTPNNTAGAPSSAPALCINTALINITHATTGATGIGAAAGLPAGVNAVWAANVITISGTPTASGVFNYSIPLTGGCGAVNATGTITVNSLPTPTFTLQPGINTCAGTDVTYTTQAGQSNYIWTVPGTNGIDYSITSGGTLTDNSLTLKWLTPGNKTVSINYTNAAGCTAASPVTSASTLVSAAPTVADAGPDQTGAATCGLTIVTLAANNPAVGSGSWSIVSGIGGIITAPASSTSTFTGTAGVTYVLRWTITNPPCPPSTADVTITFNQNPSIANAGLDQTGAAICGLTSTTLTASTPVVGTGLWTITGGAGGTVANPSSPTSAFTGTAGTAYVLRWTVSNSPCPDSFDDVNVTFHQNPTIANAGADQNGAGTCGLTTVTLAGNNPAVGIGAWTVISGAGGSFANAALSNTTFSGIAGNSYTLRWTITNPPCLQSFDDVVVTFNQNPTISNAGPDQAGAGTCGLTTVTLAANNPAIGTGGWSIFSGVGGSFANASLNNTTFTGVAGSTYVLRWTITNAPCAPSIDDVIITFNPNPTIANAGADQVGAATCGLTTVTLTGNSPVTGTGAWTIQSGAGGSFADPTLFNTTFSGSAGMTYILRWTISSPPCTPTFDDVTVTFSQNPTTANAGPDQSGLSTCGITTVTLAANTPVAGTGAWSIVSGFGGSVTTPTSPTSTFTGTAGTTYTLRWTITNAPCVASTDDVDITFNQNPTIANAGPDQTGIATCGLTTVTLAANTPVSGSGTWSIIGGIGGTITTPASPTSTFTGTGGTTYTLRWTITNAPCGASIDDVNITFNQNPTTANAGPDQTGLGMCGVTITTLAANSAVVGTGSWSIISGIGGNVISANSPTSTFTGIAGNTYVLRWTIDNPPCPLSNDDVTITFNLNPVPTFTAQPGVTACAGTDLIYTTEPGQSNYVWTYSGVLGIDYSITSGGLGTDNSVTLRWLTAGSKTVNVNYENAAGCTAPVSTSSTPTTVNPLLPVSVAIAADANPVCAGTTVSFTATPVNGGAAPLYQWKVNGINAGINAATYSYIPLTGDVVTVDLTSNAVCASGSPATSVPVNMVVNAIPVVVITSPAAVCSPTTVDLTAAAVTAGSTAGLIFTYWTDALATIAYATPATATAGTYYIKGTDPVTSCYDIKPVTATINTAPTVTITNPAAVCAPATVDLTAAAVTAGSTAGLTFTYWTDALATIAYATPATATAGTYYIKGTDPVTSCYDIKPATATINTAPTVTITNPAAVCAPATVDLTAAAVTAGSTAGLTFTYWTDALATIAYATPATATAGTYYIKGTDPVTSCYDIKPVTATANAAPTITITNPAAACAPATVDLTAAAVTAGSTAGLTFTYWTDALATIVYATPATATAGTYYIKGTDPVTSCYDIKTVTVTVNAAPTVTITIPAAVCAPATVDLTAAAVTAGSTAGLTFTYWTDALATIVYATPATATAGIYYIKGTDPVTSCFDIKPVTVTVNAVPTVTITNPAAVCSPATVDLTAAAVTAGSTAGLTFTYWTDALATIAYPTPATAAAGTYYIKGTDPVAGCFDIKPVLVIINPALSVTTSQVDVACFGGNTGNVTAIATGGSGIYTYSWNTTPPQLSVTATGLTAGIYTVTVSDGTSCTGIASATLTEPASALSGSITLQSNVTTPGGNDGSVTVAGSGGTLPYQYKIGAGAFQASGTFGTLTAGSYTVTVQDINLCTFDVPVTITEPSATLAGSVTSQTNVACFGTTTGSVTVTGSGGVPPYEYSLNSGVYQSSGTFGSLPSGIYTITVRDAILSTIDVIFTITEPASSLEGSISSQTNILCNGANTGTVTVTGSGGTPPYLYNLDGGTYQSSGTFGSLTAGTYTITVKDANLCTFDASITLTEPLTALAGSIISQTDATCSGSSSGSLTIIASGGIGPYTYSLNGGTDQASGVFANLQAATYTVTITDANLCTANVSITVSEPAALSVVSTKVDASCPGTDDGSITLTITGGTEPYSAIWLDGNTHQDRQDISGGTYSVVVTDKNGCAASLDVVVGIVGTENCLVIPDIITPNNDGFDDTWQITNIDLFPNAEIFIFTRWGKLIFHTKNLSANPWDGTFRGSPLPTDSYHYVLHLNDGSKPRSGVVSIIR